MLRAMSAIKRAILVYAMLPLNLLLAWPMVLGVRLLWGTDLVLERWILSATFKVGSWPLAAGGWPKGFYIRNRKEVLERDAAPNPWGGTSVGEGQLFGPGSRSPKGTPFEEVTRTQWHEGRHTRQARAAQVASCFEGHVLALILAIAGSPILGLVVGFLLWFLGGQIAMAGGAWLAAVLEGDPRGFYRGSVIECDAYDAGDLWELLTVEERRRRLVES